METITGLYTTDTITGLYTTDTITRLYTMHRINTETHLVNLKILKILSRQKTNPDQDKTKLFI